MFKVGDYVFWKCSKNCKMDHPFWNCKGKPARVVEVKNRFLVVESKCLGYRGDFDNRFILAKPKERKFGYRKGLYFI